MMMYKKTAIVIGSGVAGTFIATQLLQHKLYKKVIMLEAGPEFKMGDYGQWLHYVTGGSAPYESHYDTEEDFTAKGTQPWYLNGSRIFGKGGSTLHFGGWLPRFKPEDFELHQNTGRGIDWPFSYDELEPYYCEAETYLGVTGDSHNQNPPRSRPFPYDAAPYPLVAKPFIEAFETLGFSYQHLPITRYGKAENGHGKCLTVGTCNYCPVDGKFNGMQPFRTLEPQSNFELRLESPVIKLLMSAQDTVQGVSYYDIKQQRVKHLEGDAVFICSGALEAPKLLLNSRNKFWPQGIGNNHDLVGRYLSANPFFYAAGQTTSANDYQCELGFPTFASRHFDSKAFQAQGKFFMAMDNDSARIDFVTSMLAGKSPEAIQAEVSGQKTLQLFGNLEPLSYWENRVYPDKEWTKHFLPKTIIDTPKAMYDPNIADFYVEQMRVILRKMGLDNIHTGTYPQRGDHAACTCRMSDAPEQGVVNTDFTVHGINNLFMLSNAILPTLPAANPTLTLIAMGYKMIADMRKQMLVHAA
ncbi:GMC oxidoreductase [Zooshikella sp. RANM57]|uniref:GMC oxidoreductase n=1 Tax=Zooshikella sp. RANM57 TaxID=3425863 RepID=UPI003D6F758E